MISEYRVLSRGTAAATAGALIVCAAIAVFGADELLDRYAARIAALQATSPDEAAAMLAGDIRIFAVAQLAVVIALSLWLVHYGRRVLRFRASPPPGSWIVAGQHVRLGESAVLAGWLAIAAAGLVASLSCGIAVFAWRIAATT
jgi:hypothetical protein